MFVQFSKRQYCQLAVLIIFALATARNATAETHEIHIAWQPSVVFLPLLMMKHYGLLEKQAKHSGLGKLKVTWTALWGGAVMNDALLSGSLDVASGGVTPMITLWAKTRGSRLAVKGISAMCSMPILLNTRDTRIKSIRDFGSNDRIALPAVKVSIQAVTLEMAAAKVFGKSNYGKLDPLTVSLNTPDAMQALLSGKGPISSHFASPPFQEMELEHSGIHTVLNSFDVLSGPSTFTTVWTTTKFHNENPKVYGAFYAAFQKAISMIDKDRKNAAKVYLAESKNKDTVAHVLKLLDDPDTVFTTTPQNTFKYAQFMHKVGSIKAHAGSWRDLFFDNVKELPGS